MRFGKYRTDDKVLHDEYFGEQPSAAFLLAVRLVLLCLMSASLVMIYCDIYGTNTDTLIPVGIAAGFTGIVYTLTCVCPPAIIYGSCFFAGCGTLWVIRDRFIDGAAYYWDYMMMRMDSRLLKTSVFILHEELRRDPPLGSAVDEAAGTFFWSAVVLALVCSVIFTAAARTRFHITVPAIMVTAVVAPSVASEIAGYAPSFLLFVTSVFGFEAVYSSYELDNKFIYGSLTSSHMSDLRADRDHRRYVLKLPLKERIESETLRYHKYSGNMIAMAVITALVFFSAAYVIPDGKGLRLQTVLDTLDSLWTNAADRVEDAFGISIKPADDKGYFSSDSFGSISGNISIRPPGNSDRPVLEVTLSRNDIPVYLRGDIGVEYIGGSWTSITAYGERYNSAVAEDFYPESEYQVFRRYLAWTERSLSPEDALPLQMVSVKYLRGTRVVFEPLAPYELNYKTNEQFDCFGDSVLRTKLGNVKSYDGLALTPRMPFNSPNGAENDVIISAIKVSDSGSEDHALEKEFISVPEMTNAEYLEQIGKYRAFIESEYIRPSNIPAIAEISEAAKNSGISSEWDKLISGDAAGDNETRYLRAWALCRYFSDNYTYSLTADNGEDSLSGFLNDTRSGHCALFATAMTLALRDLGIPARYATGYVVYPENGTATLNGYKYVLTEKQLHAWTEVYFRGIGWLPFDPTADVPGYPGHAPIPSSPTDNVNEAVTRQAEESVTTTVTSVTTEAPATEQTEDTSADTTVAAPTTDTETEHHTESGSDLFLRLLPMIIVMTLIAAFAVIAILFFRSLANAEKRTLKSFRALPPTEATAIMYRFVMTLLAKKGLTPGNEQFYDFAERVDGSIEMKGLNNFMMDVMPVFEKCEFADPKVSPVTEDERMEVYRYVSAVYGKIVDDTSYFGRIILKISLFL